MDKIMVTGDFRREGMRLHNPMVAFGPSFANYCACSTRGTQSALNTQSTPHSSSSAHESCKYND